MESTFSAAYIMGAIFLLGSAGITVGMLAYSIWAMVSGKGLSPATAVAGGVSVEGVSIAAAGEPAAAANANRKRKPTRAA